ncbi:MAG: tetratricopeptide repeat protein, partial [Candidatus Wildermuthbacteria bacterium]|nr:tetratricopeptide repeat protein [Candidatus Wildermuthbacteria bacterium]
ATVYDQQGKSQEAIQKLEETKILAPNDIGLAFQLGVVYYQKKDFDKAQGEFERAKILDPSYANARYMLGLVYDKKGARQRAIEEFLKVSESNPSNEEVKKILANLSAGNPALAGIVPEQPPIQETPKEIQKKK